MKKIYCKIKDEIWMEDIIKRFLKINRNDRIIGIEYITIEQLWDMLDEALLEAEYLQRKIDEMENNDEKEF